MPRKRAAPGKTKPEVKRSKTVVDNKVQDMPAKGLTKRARQQVGSSVSDVKKAKTKTKKVSEDEEELEDEKTNKKSKVEKTKASTESKEQTPSMKKRRPSKATKAEATSSDDDDDDDKHDATKPGKRTKTTTTSTSSSSPPNVVIPTVSLPVLNKMKELFLEQGMTEQSATSIAEKLHEEGCNTMKLFVALGQEPYDLVELGVTLFRDRIKVLAAIEKFKSLPLQEQMEMNAL